MTLGALLTTLITGIPGIAAAAALILSRRQNQAVAEKTEAEAAVVIQGAALQLVEPLLSRIAHLEQEVAQLRGILRENDISVPPLTRTKR